MKKQVPEDREFLRDLDYKTREIVLNSRKVNTLKSGNSFGELALTEQKRRTASVIT